MATIENLGGIVRTVLGRKARFCCVACVDGFRSDRRCGLIYPSVRLVDEPGQPVVGVEEGSVRAGFCAYCDAYTSEEAARAQADGCGKLGHTPTSCSCTDPVSR